MGSDYGQIVLCTDASDPGVESSFLCIRQIVRSLERQMIEIGS